jgi:hypothetical protein
MPSSSTSERHISQAFMIQCHNHHTGWSAAFGVSPRASAPPTSLMAVRCASICRLDTLCNHLQARAEHAASCTHISLMHGVGPSFRVLQSTVLSRLQNHSLLMELLTDEGVGSMIVGSSAKTPTAHKEEKIREAIPV